MTRQERTDLIARRLAEGVTLEGIASELGVSKQRVHQIVTGMPRPCKCGCGGMLPVERRGFDLYLDGHGPIVCHCGGPKTYQAVKCLGCHQKEQFESADLSGKRFGLWDGCGGWEVLGLVYPAFHGGEGRNSQALWWCRCECGTVKGVWSGNLRLGLSQGCMACGFRRRSRNKFTR